MSKWTPYGLIGIVIILLMVLAFYIGRARPDEQMIHDIVTQRQTQLQQEYDVKVTELERQIRVLSADLAQAKARYKTLKEKIEQKAKEVNNVTPPTSVDDTKRRFTDLGYTPK